MGEPKCLNEKKVVPPDKVTLTAKARQLGWALIPAVVTRTK